MRFDAMALRLRENWKSGVTVSLVAIPLSVSLAIAAHASPVMGIITAVWAGFFAALFGGSHFNVVGPTGALSGILATYALVHGTETLPFVALMAGFIILVCFIFRLDQYIVFIPSCVIHGFTLGVALIIALNQLNFAFGLSGLAVHEKFILNVWESFVHARNTDLISFALFAVTLAFLFVWLKKFPRLPGPIIVAPIGILLGYLASVQILPFSLQTLFTKFGAIDPVIWQFPSYSWGFFSRDLLTTAMAVALIGILETLISAKIADGMTKTRFHQRKEMFGLGLANVASGITGGIPATAALARTALNVKSGATHRTSAVISSLGTGLISLLLLPTFRFLPLPVVASILVYVAARMIEREHFFHMFRHDKGAFFLSLFVAFITIVEDPIVGILVGSSASLLLFVNKLSKGQSEITFNKNKQIVARLTNLSSDSIEAHGPDLIVYRFAGQMTYINAHAHLEMLGHIDEHVTTVILSLRSLFYIDLDGLDRLKDIVEMLEARGVRIWLSAPGPYLMPLLAKEPWFIRKQTDHEVFSHTSEALQQLGYAVRSIQAMRGQTVVS